MKLSENQKLLIITFAGMILILGLINRSAEIPREATIIIIGKRESVGIGRSYFIYTYDGDSYYVPKDLYDIIEIGSSYRIVYRGVLSRVTEAYFIKRIGVFQ